MKKADFIVHNARVYTCDSSFSVIDCFAVSEGKIAAVGTYDDVTKAYESDIKIDAGGRFIFPGFIDAHSHFMGYGMNGLRYADLSNTATFEETIERVKAHNETFDNEWILGRGWDQNKWPGKEFPDKKLLDVYFPDKPVYLIRVDGHAALVNSKALQLAGIDKTTSIDGGEILSKGGEPTGVLIDNAMDLVRTLIPSPGKETKADALLLAEKNCFAVGLTSVTDAGLLFEDIMLIDSLQKGGLLNMRINAMLEPDEFLEDHLKQGIIITNHLSMRAVKMYADGALGSRGACLLEPYTDKEDAYGMLVATVGKLDSIARLAYKYGFQVCTHAIGDSANRTMLDIYGKILKTKNDLRWRIEHAQVVHPDDLVKFSRYNIIPSVQATHATSDMYWAGERLGPERLLNAYTYQKLLTQNGWLCNGTDFPIEHISPIKTFYAAVVRKDLSGFPEDGFMKDQALSRRDAMMSITLWAAKAAFEEGVKGSIEPGKYADFVILDRDLMTITDDSIPLVKVVATYSAGTKVYEN